MFDAHSLLMQVRDVRPDDYHRMVASVKNTTPCIPLHVAVQYLKDRTLLHHHAAIDQAVRRGVETDTLLASLAAVLLYAHGPQGAADVIQSLAPIAFPHDLLYKAGTTVQRWNCRKRPRDP